MMEGKGNGKKEKKTKEEIRNTRLQMQRRADTNEKRTSNGAHTLNSVRTGFSSDLGLGRGTALRFLAPIDRNAVQWGLGAISGLASPEGKREKVVIRFLLLPVTVLAMEDCSEWDMGMKHLRELPGDIVLCIETLVSFLERCEITRGHHTGPVPRGARNR